MSNKKYLKYKKKYLDLKLNLDNNYLMKGGFIDEIEFDFDVFFGNFFTDLINDYNNGRMFRIGIKKYFINKRNQLKSTLEKFKSNLPDKSELKEKLRNIFFPTNTDLIKQLIILKKLDDSNPSKSKLRLAGNSDETLSSFDNLLPPGLPPQVLPPQVLPPPPQVLPPPPQRSRLASIPTPDDVNILLGKAPTTPPTTDWLQIELSRTDHQTYEIEEIPPFSFPISTDETPANLVEPPKIPKNSNNFLQFIFDIIYQIIIEI